MADSEPTAIPGTETMPDDLLAAFVDYERAVVEDDLDALDAWFAPGEGTMRGDGSGLLVGHEAIRAFRSLRGGVSPRRIERVEHRELAVGVALVVSVSLFDIGGRGLQTQVWERGDEGWRVTAAHVSPRPQPFDRTIWRTVGDPLFQGAWEGPLAGRTVAVKDLFAITGYRIGAGNPTFLDGARRETSTAPAVSDLLRAGASLRGIARTDEFAYSIAGDNAHYGTPPNGAVPGALPGGSSSGPASAVATGQADIGLATDTAGSVRVPASYQGLWGLRTTHDLVSRQGLLPLAQSFDTVGWLARTGETLQAVSECCLPSAGEPDLPWRFIVPSEALDAVEPATRAAFEELLARLDLPVDEVSIGPLADYHAPFRVVQGAESWRNDGDWVREHPDAVGSAVAARFRAAAEVTAREEQEARVVLALLKDRLDRLLADAMLILPTVPGPAPPRTAPADRVDAIRTATLRLTAPAAVAGAPALSVPLMRIGRAPVGACVVSRAGSDAALVRRALRLAAMAGVS